MGVHPIQQNATYFLVMPRIVLQECSQRYARHSQGLLKKGLLPIQHNLLPGRYTSTKRRFLLSQDSMAVYLHQGLCGTVNPQPWLVAGTKADIYSNGSIIGAQNGHVCMYCLYRQVLSTWKAYVPWLPPLACQLHTHTAGFRPSQIIFSSNNCQMGGIQTQAFQTGFKHSMVVHIRF